MKLSVLTTLHISHIPDPRIMEGTSLQELPQEIEDVLALHEKGGYHFGLLVYIYIYIYIVIIIYYYIVIIILLLYCNYYILLYSINKK